MRLEPREGKAPDAFASEHTLRGLFKTVSKQDYEWYVARMAEMEYGLILNSSEIIDESQLIQMLKEKYHLLECSIDVAVTTGMSLCKESVYALSAFLKKRKLPCPIPFSQVRANVSAMPQCKKANLIIHLFWSIIYPAW